jgi:uncharacterized protein YjbJ (UPF0337 family)
MNKDQVIGKWEEIKGSVREQWGKLTDDDITEIEGSRQKLAGKLQKYYGVASEKAEDQIREWEDTVSRKRNRVA